MPHILAGLLAAMQLILPFLAPHVLTNRLRSGEYLRMHVVAQDDTSEMQRVKLCVRDAVQQCFQREHDADLPTMQAQADALLPRLTEAACECARAEGFAGDVTVSLGMFPFEERTLNGIAVPAGEYPALMILLGDAQGQNWWGLLDPEASLQFAQAGEAEAPVLWDWSLRALLAALLGLPMPPEGA